MCVCGCDGSMAHRHRHVGMHAKQRFTEEGIKDRSEVNTEETSPNKKQWVSEFHLIEVGRSSDQSMQTK